MAIMKTAEIQQYFRGLEYPAQKTDLLVEAQELGADDEILELIFSLPDQEYQTPADVSEAIEGLSAEKV